MNHPETVGEPEGTAEPGSQPPPDLVRASLERILVSTEFAGSDQLSRFLRYVVESRLSPKNVPLKESLIGVSVFRRGPAYDPKVDPIVRVEARRLRSRLDSYYAGTGVTDPIRISLPKGGYSPQFEIVKPPAAEAPPEPSRPPRDRVRKWRILYVTIGLVVIAALFTLLLVARHGTAPERLVSQFWSSLLDSDRTVLIVPADSGLVMWEGLTHRTVHLSDYITGKYRVQIPDGGDLEPHVIQDLSRHRYTSMADLDFALGLSRRPEAARRGFRTCYARDLRLDEVRSNNLILLGAKHSNPWVELFEPDAAFRIEHDEVTSAFRVLSASPGQRGSAQTVTVVQLPDLEKEIYGVVSCHRNREGSGVVLMVQGTTIAGTEAAGALVFDDVKLLPWLRKAEANGRMRGFDILLRAQNLGGGAPRAEVVAFRADEEALFSNSRSPAVK
jgi:hypothetical protein